MRRPRVTAAARRLFLVALGLLLALLAAAFLATQVPAVRAYILRGMESRLTHYVGREVRVEIWRVLSQQWHSQHQSGTQVRSQ